MGCRGRTRRALPAARLLLLLPFASEGEVSCGGHEAPDCASCPEGRGPRWCNGDCIWAGGTCQRRSGALNWVSCGGHYAASCAQCPWPTAERQESWCNGDCVWQRGPGRCVARPAEAMPELDDLLGELGRLGRGLQGRAPELGDRATYIRNAIVGSGSRQRQREMLWMHMRDPGDRPRHLDALFDLLRRPRSAAEAKDVESLIWASLEWHQDENLRQQMTRTRTLLELGLLSDALRAGWSMVELDPGFAEAWYQLALVLARMGRGTESLEQLDRALSLEPRHFGALAAKGKLLAAAGSRGEVLECLHEVKRVHPHFNCSELEAALEL